MEFLREPLLVSLAVDERGERSSFAADLFSPRPSFEEIKAFQGWGERLQEDIAASIKRKACPVQWLAFFIDTEGAWMLAAAKTPVQMNNMRAALTPILRTLPAEQLRAVKNTLRPLDEVDRNRIAAWNTIDAVRPKVQRPEPEEEEVTLFFRKEGESGPVAPEPGPPTLAEFLDQDSDEICCYAEPQALPQTLMLRGCAWEAPAHEALNSGDSRAALAAWVLRAQVMATIVVAQSGPPPALNFCHCHREERRHLLLVQRLMEMPDHTCAPLAYIVQEAAAMAREGKIPGLGKNGRKSEFMERCAKAVKAVDSQAETDADKLSYMDKAVIRRALGGSVPHEGCLNEDCLTKKPSWFERFPGGWTRCSHCNLPYSYKRTWDTLRSLQPQAFRDLSVMTTMEVRDPDWIAHKRRRLQVEASSWTAMETHEDD